MDGHEGPKEIHTPPEFFNWLSDPVKNGAGALFDFGCYGANLMTWMMDNQRPLRVTAMTQQIKPDIYAVNEDGDKPQKREYCHAKGIEYLVLKRVPKAGLPRRQSTSLRGF